MKALLKQEAAIFCATVAICFFYASVVSAWSFSVAQQNLAPVEFVMGTAVPVTYRVCNNSSGNGNESLRNVRFYLANNTYTILPNPETFVAPNWTCSRNSALRIYCSANNAAAYIPAGTNCSQHMDFTFYINSAALTQDRIDQLSNVTARFTGSNTYRNLTAWGQNSWTWKSFQMTLVPSASVIGRNCPFTLTMTVTNKMSATNITNPNYVTAQPKPPSMTTLSGGATAAPVLPVPADIVPLNAGLASTMTWSYLAGNNLGTLNFSANASDRTAIRTSSIVTTPTITVNAVGCGFIVSSVTVTPNCLVSGGIATLTMVVSNTSGITLNNVAPAALIRNGAATIGAPACTFPVPCSYASLNSGFTGTFIWTAPVTANPADAIGQDYSVTGTATSTTPGYLATNPVLSNTQFIDGYTVAISPATLNANSTFGELVWTVTNSACNSVNRVSIALPGGWPAPSNSYSEVDNGATLVNTWNYAAPAFSTPTYPVPDATNDLPNGGHVGTYYLLFSSPTPNVTGPYMFTTTITDTAGVSKVYNYLSETVTVNAFDPSASGSNFTETNIWHEDVK